MKQLLAFTAFLATGFLLGNRRARKAGPACVINCAVEVDTSQATAALKALEARAVHAQRAVSTLTSFACAGYLPAAETGRCTGQTTRLVDAAIQTLFTSGEVRVRDHVDHRPTHKFLYEKVVKRLSLEHSRDAFVFYDRTLTIQLVKPSCKR